VKAPDRIPIHSTAIAAVAYSAESEIDFFTSRGVP
jgi:hypothetical protein